MKFEREVAEITAGANSVQTRADLERFTNQRAVRRIMEEGDYEDRFMIGDVIEALLNRVPPPEVRREAG